MKAETIAFFITGLNKGGAETQLKRLASVLKEEGREVHVVSLLAIGEQGRRDRVEGVNYHSLGMERGKARVGDLYRAVRLLREIEPDVVTCFCFHANLLGAIAGKLAAVPVVISSIRGERFGSRAREWAEIALDRLGLRDVVTTNSKHVADGLIERRIAREEKTVVMPNGIVTDAYRAGNGAAREIRRELGIDEDRFMWLAVGNLRSAKDYPTLLRAFPYLGVESEAVLCIAGGMHDESVVSEVEMLRHDLGAPERVRLLGARDDVPRLLAGADGFVLSSAHEGLPNAVMEALSASVPVVATDVGGVRELVVHGESGFVVPPRDSEALAEGMMTMMDLEEGQRAMMGRMGAEHIEERFGLQEVVRRWDRLFSEMLEARREGKKPELLGL